ncbi:hypothetical protein LCGC14_1786070 [marine sediment metagenome]|uniref:Uncharacterized protein n=1 Tax=marine sediment metagenome TaxID=412755 RepID=A0A0F9HGI6_9ZZZZ
MTDELNELKKKDLKHLLLTELGYDQETVDWFYKRNTAEGLRALIRNDRAFDIITRLANEAGRGRCQ